MTNDLTSHLPFYYKENNPLICAHQIEEGEKKKNYALFKVFIEFVTLLFLFNVLVRRPVGSLLPNQGLNMHPLYWKAKS